MTDTKTDKSKLKVEDFVTFLVNMGGVYEVDSDGYVVKKEDHDELVVTKVGNSVKQIMVIKEKITDTEALVINPLNENLAESPDSKWIYSNLNVGLAMRIISVVRSLRTVLELESARFAGAKKQDDDAESSSQFSSSVIAFASRHTDFDSKAAEAFELITKKKVDFVSIWYNRKLKEAKFRCSVYNPDSAADHPTVSKKSWKAITSLMSELLGVSPDLATAQNEIEERFVASSDLITVPKLESMLTIFSRVYSKLNKYLGMCEKDDEHFIIDLSRLDYHIRNLDGYYQKAKWFITSSNTVAYTPETIRTIEGSGGIQLPMSDNPQYQRPAGGASDDSILNHPALQHARNAPTNQHFNPQGYQQPIGYQQQPQPGWQQFQQPSQPVNYVNTPYQPFGSTQPQPMIDFAGRGSYQSSIFH